MNFRKITSGIAALAIAATAFAGLGVTASADVGYSENFEGYEVGVTGAGGWTSANTGRYTALVAETDGNKYLNVATGSNNNGTSVSTTSATVAAGTDYTLSFDMALTRSSDQTSSFQIIGADSQDVIRIGQSAGYATTYYLNRDTSEIKLTLTNDTWYHYEVTRVGVRTYLSVKDSSGNDVYAKTYVPYSSAAGGLSKLQYNTGRYRGGMKIDNLSITAADTSGISGSFVTIQTAPYAQCAVNGKNYYSDYSGKAYLGHIATNTDLEYTITKNGYTGVSGTYTVEDGDCEISAPLTINHHLYYEDFATAGVFSASGAIRTGVTVQNGGDTVSVNDRMTVSNSNTGPRKSYVPISTSETGFKMTMSVRNTIGSSNQGTSDVVLLGTGSTPIAIIQMTKSGGLSFGQGTLGNYNANSTISGTSGSTTYTSGTSFDVEIIQNATTNTLTITANGTTATIENITPRAIANLILTPGRSNSVAVDNIVIDRYPQYAVTIGSHENTNVSTDVETAGAGDTVTVTTEADAGYVITNVAVATTASGSPCEVTDNGDGTYSFTMPSEAVTVTVTAVLGYVINTKPYAAISIDGEPAVSTGRTGQYIFSQTGEHSVEITKDGYQTVSETITAVAGGSISLPLTPNAGIVYQEDFTYVEDNFGGTNGIINVANGVLRNAFVSSSITNEVVALNESVDLAGTVTTIRISANRNDRLGYFALRDSSSGSSPIGFYFRGNDKVYYQHNQTGGYGIGLRSRDTSYHLIQIYLPTSDDASHRPVAYVDGIKCSADIPRTAIRSIDSLSMSSANSSGSTTIMSVDYIKVESLESGNTEPTATVTVSGVSTSYLKGTTVTLPTSSTGYWTDGTTEYPSNYEFAAESDVSFEEAYVITSPECIDAPASKYTGSTVTFSAAEGYRSLSGVTVTKTSDSSAVEVSGSGDGPYTFTMPNEPVTISAVATEFAVSCDDNTSVGNVEYAAQSDSITISITSGRTVSGTPVVTKTGDSATTVLITDNGNGTYTFLMPAYPVTVNAFAYTTPTEVTYNTDPVHHWYNTSTNTTGDGYYARGFTFSAFSGGRAMTSIAVTIDASKQADDEGNITNIGERITGASAANSGKTSTVSGMNITGEAVFGLMIWTNDTEKINTIDQFNPATGITIAIN